MLRKPPQGWSAIISILQKCVTSSDGLKWHILHPTLRSWFRWAKPWAENGFQGGPSVNMLKRVFAHLEIRASCGPWEVFTGGQHGLRSSFKRLATLAPIKRLEAWPGWQPNATMRWSRPKNVTYFIWKPFSNVWGWFGYGWCTYPPWRREKSRIIMLRYPGLGTLATGEILYHQA